MTMKNRTFLIFLSAMFILLMLCACSSNAKAPSADLVQAEVNAAVNDVLSSLHSENLFYARLQQHLRIDVLTVTEDAGRYFARCKITTFDFAQAIIGYISSLDPQSVASPNDILLALQRAVSQAPMMQREYSIEIAASEGGFYPIFTEELVDFCCGNLQAVQSYLTGILEGMYT